MSPVNTKSKWIAAFENVEAPSLRSTSTPKSLYSHLREPAGSEAASGDWKKRNGNKIKSKMCHVWLDADAEHFED